MSEPDEGAVSDPALEDSNSNTPKSALQDNIERKGKNAYYFAHSHKANGPQWDGQAEPRLLSRTLHESHDGHRVTQLSAAFEYSKSNITTYAFLDEPKKVKLYIEMPGIGDKCTDDDITLDFTETSLCLVVNNYKPEPQCLCFGRLTAPITNASFKIKDNRIILTLNKTKEGYTWHTINDKGEADHEVV
jgi:hypothetical protein